MVYLIVYLKCKSNVDILGIYSKLINLGASAI